jgi:sugar-specific transcriptional regulator TrmB
LKTKLLEADCCEQELEETKRKLCKACKQIKSCDTEIEKLIVGHDETLRNRTWTIICFALQKIIENQQQDIENLDENLRRSRLEVEQMSNLQSDVKNLKEQLSFAIDNRIAEETSLMNHRNIPDFHTTMGHIISEPSSSRSSRRTATLFEQTISRTSR